ncbi:MAG TPA: hypothetical protein VJ124_01015 [Pyrinomonadaceae bacterium]|nr:hypothetical protein [Pyrinomonadaceae bacterium]
MENRSDGDDIAGRLQQLEKRFEREMRARGFDPQQAATVPLTPRLANLYRELEELRHEIRIKRERDLS